ncbi:MAG: universal stress protein [Proteobacteria bacterium]|nr:universal stress protein [Pseudomonadota bacterium]MBU1139590.1 universal stress protein [Pseudomonadota bacterium]MBU1417373.1 universal stress protein [Pseudomonadota bacterium]
MNDWKRILIAVDQSQTSIKALSYTADITSNLSDAELCLLYIYPEPPPNYYSSGGSLSDYQQQKTAAAEVIFQNSMELLEKYALGEKVTTRCKMADHITISQAVLEVQAEGKFGTVVVGKRGVSKAEEFLFGSISNGIVHHCHDFTVWVVG